jgi:Rrf2 family protein
MFSKTCEYAIRAMLFLAQKSEHTNKLGIGEISKGIDAPAHFLAKILQDLSRKKLVQSIKGPNGGFYLDESLRRTTLADIVIAIDGDNLFTGCGLGLKICSEKNPCPLHDEFKAIRKKIYSMLESATVVEFNMELIKGLTHLKR